MVYFGQALMLRNISINTQTLINVFDDVIISIYKGTLEKSKVISITTEDPAAVESLRKVGDAYKQQFNQESVMYAVTHVPILQFT